MGPHANGTWTLSGEKIWITNGGIADLYTVFARTTAGGGKITAFLVETAWPGVSHGSHEDKMGIRASSTTTVSFADVRVPADNVLDTEGKGFKVAMVEVLRLYIALSGLKDLGRSLSEIKSAVDDIFNNPIKGFGVLTDYAEKRLTQATGVRRDKISAQMPQPLREAADIYERYTVELAKASDYLLRKHGKSIADRQHDLKRIADLAIDLFVGLCVLSRAATLGKSAGEQGTQAVAMARIFAQQAKRRMANIVRRITRNEDEEMNSLAGFIVNNGSYPWDVVS